MYVEWYYCCNDSNLTHSSFWSSLQLKFAKLIFTVSQNVDTSGATYRYNTIAALICVCMEWHCAYRKSTLLESFLCEEWIEKCWPRQQSLSSFESSLMNNLLRWWQTPVTQPVDLPLQSVLDQCAMCVVSRGQTHFSLSTQFLCCSSLIHALLIVCGMMCFQWWHITCSGSSHNPLRSTS